MKIFTLIISLFCVISCQKEKPKLVFREIDFSILPSFEFGFSAKIDSTGNLLVRKNLSFRIKEDSCIFLKGHLNNLQLTQISKLVTACRFDTLKNNYDDGDVDGTAYIYVIKFDSLKTKEISIHDYERKLPNIFALSNKIKAVIDSTKTKKVLGNFIFESRKFAKVLFTPPPEILPPKSLQKNRK